VSKLSRQELLWEDERLRTKDLDVDDPHRRIIKNSGRVPEEYAARIAFGNEKAESDQLDNVMEFLLCSAIELTDDQLQFRNELLRDYRLASLLRIYEPDVWYVQFCTELGQYVIPRWEEIKNSWTQTRQRLKKNLKKVLADGVTPPRAKNSGPRGKKRGT
jgi:hypothetical protein